jgi:phytoene dehydrogenase-like protein
VMIPTLADPSLAPSGEHVVIVQALLPPEASDSLDDDRRLGERMLELAEHVLPGLGGSLTKVVGAARGGAAGLPVHRMEVMYGWELSPKQAGRRRLPQEAPVEGLLLAGQWTQPGGGVITVVASGIQAARLALGRPASRGVLPLDAPTPGSS